jgi:hypothetical protein
MKQSWTMNQSKTMKHKSRAKHVDNVIRISCGCRCRKTNERRWLGFRFPLLPSMRK